MTTIQHPIRVTPLAVSTLQARISLHENQAQFARRFLVSRQTIINWETGKSGSAQKIHLEILGSITKNLIDEGKLVPREAIMAIFQDAAEKRGLAGSQT